MKTFITAITSLALLFVCLPLYGGTLEAELDYKVRAICQYMNGKQYTQVSLLPIGGISEATGTNRIGAVLQEKLSANGVEMVGSGAPVQLDIEVSIGTNDATLFIEIELKTNRGQKLRDWTGEFEYEIGQKKVHVEVDKGSTIAEVDYADDVQKILSIPYADHHLPPDVKTANKIKLKEIAKAYDNPKSYIKEKTKVSAHESGLYQMEIVTTHDPHMAAGSYKPVHTTTHNKYPYAELHKGDMIGVRLYNHSDEVAAVEVCLDGIGSFFFSSSKGFKHYKIPPKSSILVRGFHQSFDPHTSTHHYKHFQIVDYSNSAWLHAQQTGFKSLPEAQGSISAHFSKELPKHRGANAAPDHDLIGQGKDFSEKAKVEKMKIGPVCETIVVHYHKPPAH